MSESENDRLARLDPKTRARLVAAEELATKKLETPSLGLNLALGGGLGYGRTSMIWGNKSAGKSSVCLQMIGKEHALGDPGVAWVDGESSFDRDWAERFGVDMNRINVTRSKTISKATRDVISFLEAGYKIIVVDSISVLLPSMYFDKQDQLKDVEDLKQLGQESLQLKYMVNQINAMNEDAVVILISQYRMNLSGMYPMPQPTGGNAVKFNCSTVLKFWASEAKDKQIKGDVQHGDRAYEEDIGRPVNWLVDFNKLGPMNQVGTYDFYYQGDAVGIDSYGEVVDYAERYGVIKKGGAWYSYEDNKWQGRHGVIKALHEDSALYERIVKELGERV